MYLSRKFFAKGKRRAPIDVRRFPKEKFLALVLVAVLILIVLLIILLLVILVLIIVLVPVLVVVHSAKPPFSKAVTVV